MRNALKLQVLLLCVMLRLGFVGKVAFDFGRMHQVDNAIMHYAGHYVSHCSYHCASYSASQKSSHYAILHAIYYFICYVIQYYSIKLSSIKV